MCTVTFIARKHGYALGMNRDEQLSRVPGLPPSEKTINGCRVLAPSEPGGGTWIALNERGRDVRAHQLVCHHQAGARENHQPGPGGQCGLCG